MKLRGDSQKTPAHGAEGAQFLSARGARPEASHGPLQRLLVPSRFARTPRLGHTAARISAPVPRAIGRSPTTTLVFARSREWQPTAASRQSSTPTNTSARYTVHSRRVCTLHPAEKSLHGRSVVRSAFGRLLARPHQQLPCACNRRGLLRFARCSRRANLEARRPAKGNFCRWAAPVTCPSGRYMSGRRLINSMPSIVMTWPTRRLTVKLRGRTEAPALDAEGAQFLSARGANQEAPHGPLGRDVRRQHRLGDRHLQAPPTSFASHVCHPSNEPSVWERESSTQPRRIERERISSTYGTEPGPQTRAASAPNCGNCQHRNKTNSKLPKTVDDS